MKYIDAERLKEWLEKQADIEFKKTEENASSLVLCHFHNGCRMQALDTIDFIDSLQQEQPDADLEKAAQHVYESWMGGTMNDFLRDMVELGRVFNERKEEKK